MAKKYQHVGTLPIVVGDYGRVIPGQAFSCEMDPAQEAYFVRINALRVVEELEDGAAVEAPPLDGVWPTNWPATPAEQFKREGVKPLPDGGR